nr:3-ketoacyl-CoA thiolase 2, peroxisomal [Tanacetum cinerariifolium]
MKQETLYFMQQPPTTVGAAAEMLCRAPSLHTMTDKLGETALFHAVRYGKTKISNFLEEQVIRNYPTEENLRAGMDPKKRTLLKLDFEKNNVAVTRACCVATLLHEMKRRGRDCRFGVVSMCIGTGMGAAAVFERGDSCDDLSYAK